MPQLPESGGMTRRDFLKTMGVLAGTITLFPADVTNRWRDEWSPSYSKSEQIETIPRPIISLETSCYLTENQDVKLRLINGMGIDLIRSPESTLLLINVDSKKTGKVTEFPFQYIGFAAFLDNLGSNPNDILTSQSLRIKDLMVVTEDLNFNSKNETSIIQNDETIGVVYPRYFTVHPDRGSSYYLNINNSYYSYPGFELEIINSKTQHVEKSIPFSPIETYNGNFPISASSISITKLPGLETEYFAGWIESSEEGKFINISRVRLDGQNSELDSPKRTPISDSITCSQLITVGSKTYLITTEVEPNYQRVRLEDKMQVREVFENREIDKDCYVLIPNQKSIERFSIAANEKQAVLAVYGDFEGEWGEENSLKVAYLKSSHMTTEIESDNFILLGNHRHLENLKINIDQNTGIVNVTGIEGSTAYFYQIDKGKIIDRKAFLIADFIPRADEFNLSWAQVSIEKNKTGGYILTGIPTSIPENLDSLPTVFYIPPDTQSL